MHFPRLFGVSSLALLALPASASAQYQPQGGITFFSNTNFTGARFTVRGPGANVRLPFTARSLILRQGDRWQVCRRTNYRDCAVFTRSDRSLSMIVRSLRPLAYAPPVMPSPWQDIARLAVRQGVLWDRANVLSNRQYRQIIVCAERNVVRLARMDVFFDNGRRQTFHTPLVLRPGQCSGRLDLDGRARRIHSLTFTYQGWNPAYRGGIVVVRALQR